MLLYLTVTSNGLFLFESFEERVAQKSVFQDYFKTNHTAKSGDYGKMFHGKYQGSLKITKSHCRFPVFVYLGGQSHKVSMKLKSKRISFISLLKPFEIDRRWTDRLKLE